MRLTRVLAGVGLMSVAAAASARADFKDFSNRCTPGSITACASMTVFTTPNGTGTTVVIMVRNLQGWVTSNDNTGGSLIQRIGIVAPTVSGPSGLVVSTSGTVGQVGTPAPLWSLRAPGGLGGIIELDVGTGGTVPFNKKDGGIAGCGAPGVVPPNYFSTCNTGWVVFTFSTANAWSAGNSDVAFLFNDFASTPNTPNSGVECDTDNIPVPRPQCFVATPEPVTMILLGSGLASMGGFGLVRRRKGTDVSSD